MTLLSGAGLAVLLDSHPAPETFGPESPMPGLAFRLEDAQERLAARLAVLPCPVIGVGEGPLAGACDVVLETEARLPGLLARVAAAPIAAMVLVQHLRASEHLPVAAALTAESMAYATVQTGPEFRCWQRRAPAMETFAEEGLPLLVDFESGGVLRLTMNRPLGLNAIGVEMRDALCEAFDLAAIDPDIERLVLAGAGRCFSVGGDIREFGLASDPATAHWVRSVRLPAARLAPIAERLKVCIHGGAIGAGVEIAAFGAHVVANADAWFQLPEINYGLIPGAGGTVSVPRRIGRQRAAEMMLSARRVRAAEALDWGLIDAIGDQPSSTLSAPASRAGATTARSG